uniref:SRC kinase signaling inhibitor 1 n=1 Tax=Molossus molossus TaxID=27622 RepID=A0A7J8D2Z7_MOLMO|nr:SRC kinase signaling inhibitor 1 [Molossus molossus]
MKVVTPGASRLKAAQGQAGSPDKGKHGKQRAEYMRIQAQQQCVPADTGWGRGEKRDFDRQVGKEQRGALPSFRSG